MTVKVSVPASGEHLSMAQVVTLCRDMSGDAAAIARAAAICFAESGGVTNAVLYNCKDRASGRAYSSKTNNADAWSVDRGLWQINSYWHPEVTDAAAFDPKGAVSAAFHISHAFRDFSAWATNDGPTYHRYYPIALSEAQAQLAGETPAAPLTAATAAVGGALLGAGDAAVAAGKGAVAGVDSVAGFLGQLGSRATWVRVLEVVGGLTALVVGAFLLEQDLTRAALGAIPGVGGVAGKLAGSAAKEAAAAAAAGA